MQIYKYKNIYLLVAEGCTNIESFILTLSFGHAFISSTPHELCTVN